MHKLTRFGKKVYLEDASGHILGSCNWQNIRKVSDTYLCKDFMILLSDVEDKTSID